MTTSTQLFSRDRKMAEYAKANPCATLQQIGDYHGLTRERVRQILIRLGVHKANAHSARARPRVLCAGGCGRSSPESNRLPHNDYRCRACSRRVSVACSLCDKLFKRYRSQITSGTRYTYGMYFCPSCVPLRLAALGRALGHLPKTKGGGSVRDPELFRQMYLKELSLLREELAGREGTIDG
jgi:hypothetical protein